MAFGRHPLLKFRMLFPNKHTKTQTYKLLRTMAQDCAQTRENEKMVKSMLGGDSSMPSIEKLLSKAVMAGLQRKYSPNAPISKDYAPGALVYVARGAMRVQNMETTNAKVLWSLRPGEMYGDHQVLSGATTVTKHTLFAGHMGCEAVILDKEYLMTELLSDLPFAVRFFRDLATAVSKRLYSEKLLTYGTYWRQAD